MSTSPREERLIERFTNLWSELEKEKTAAEPPGAVRVRGIPGMPQLPDIDTLIGTITEFAKDWSPVVALVLGMTQILQWLVSRKHKDRLIVSRVVGMLHERGIDAAEAALVKAWAVEELRARGIPERKLAAAATQVVAILAEELAPRREGPPSAEPSAQFHKIVKLIRDVPQWQCEDQSYGYSVRVPVQGKLGSAVRVTHKGRDESGREMLEFAAICGKAEMTRLAECLRRSGKLHTGAFTIRKVDGQDHFVIQERVPVDKVDFGEISRIIPYLAAQADELSR